MERHKQKSRGRPRANTIGARDAFDIIQNYRRQENISFNELAIRFGLTPSSVARALADREGARWTPTFKTLYRIAKNEEKGMSIFPAIKRLAAYEGPGEVEIKRLLGDVEALITTLTTARR